MTDDYSLSAEKEISRLEAIKTYLSENSNKGYSPYFKIRNLYEVDPAAESPYVVSDSFIPEEVGGGIEIVESDSRGRGETVANENINQMLSSFLPGGYMERWRGFSLWRGDWSRTDERGVVDIGDMFGFEDRKGLEEVVSGETEGYTPMGFDTEDVEVCIPRSMFVKRIGGGFVNYYWDNRNGVVTEGDHPDSGSSDVYYLGGTDPTTNYLWFKHLDWSDDDEVDSYEPVSDGGEGLLRSMYFSPEETFLRCYYGSLLTIYEKETNDTLSKKMLYTNEGGGRSRAFVTSEERSQVLLSEIDRETVRERVRRCLSERDPLRRSLQFSLLHRKVWDELFFRREELEHVFEIEPLMNHIVGVDFWNRRVRGDDRELFELDAHDILDRLKELLADPGSGGRLLSMGYDEYGSSSYPDVIERNDGFFSEAFDACLGEELVDFAEEVFVHSAKHAMSSWSAKEANVSGSFEMWYDVNFQEGGGDEARIAVYDDIEGGSGISKEVFDYIREAEPDIETGLRSQGICHTALAEEVCIDFLADRNSDSLYDLYTHDRERFREGIEQEVAGKISEVVGDVGGDDIYNEEDVASSAFRRIDGLFETRGLARFYGYVASRYRNAREDIGRLPRSVDMVLELNQHVFRDPRVRETYDGFRERGGRRDISELAERLEAVTVQCRTACPDCLKTEISKCVHGNRYQEKMLSRELLFEVCTGGDA